MADNPQSNRRIDAIDVARGTALLAMASFHFTWDLEFFGYLEPGTATHGFLKLYARAIASSFLFLAGVSLVLASRGGMRWNGFWRRFVAVAGAAGLITLGTYLAIPDEFIFFGILHHIALASLIGLLFLRSPPVVTLIAATLMIAAPHFLRSTVFDHPWLWWVGLSTINLRSNDYVPVFPWFGVVLVGIAAAVLAERSGVFNRLARWTPRRTSVLGFLGRHSLAFYLVHQPVLIAALWLFSLAVPASPVTPKVQFTASCERSCNAERDADFCARYCNCMLDNVERGGLIGKVFERQPDERTKEQVANYGALCAGIADDAP